jgi:EAL domain-containing protein (putative c-di-GMP-specific phosphodiesterase class I)
VPSPTDSLSPTADIDWGTAIDRAVTDGAFTVVTQPVIDLARGAVVGYEALSRFGGPPPDQWFAAVAGLGRGVDLAARVLQRQLGLRDHLPPNCFLAVNVSPDHLATDPVLAVLGDIPLGGVVLELTEHDRFPDLRRLREQIDRLRAQGAISPSTMPAPATPGSRRCSSSRPTS